MKLATNTPSRSRRFEYDRMTQEQFHAALEQLGMTPLYFARISGVNRKKVERFVSGEEDIPHFVTVLCSLLTLPGAKDMASTVTNAVIHFHAEETNDA